MQTASIDQTERRELRALLALSDFPEDVRIEQVSNLICHAPDPETAAREIFERIPGRSDALTRKWKKVIDETWSAHNTHVARSLDISLASADVAHSAALIDAHALLAEVQRQPVELACTGKGCEMTGEEVTRLARTLPSVRTRRGQTFRHEAECTGLCRIRSALMALRLLRVYNGRLVVVHSRMQRFLRLPPVHQYYALWHAEVYHIHWGFFASQWHPYVQTIQNYLPLLWELTEEVQEGLADNVNELVCLIMETYQPLWHQEGLDNVGGPQSFFTLYRHGAVAAAIEQAVVGDIFARYGLIQTREVEYDPSGRLLFDDDNVSWSRAGERMLAAERQQELPCGVEIADNR